VFVHYKSKQGGWGTYPSWFGDTWPGGSSSAGAQLKTVSALDCIIREWILTNKGRVDASVLDELSGEFVNHARIGEWRRAFDVHLLANLLQKFVGLVRVEFLEGRKLLSCSPFELRTCGC
jgi:hypothetical protein